MSNPPFPLSPQPTDYTNLPEMLDTSQTMNTQSLPTHQQSASPQHFGHGNQQQQHARSTLSHQHASLPQPPAPAPPIDSLQYSSHHDQTTMVLGVLGYLERLEREVAEMRAFVNLGFKKLNDVEQMDGGLGARVEGVRLQVRNWNRANVTELEEEFKLLPRSNGDFPTDIPTTGTQMRDMNHKLVEYLLDLYDIPFIPTMFLAEKKMLYLRFIGANRVVMHRILD